MKLRIHVKCVNREIQAICDAAVQRCQETVEVVELSDAEVLISTDEALARGFTRPERGKHGIWIKQTRLYRQFPAGGYVVSWRDHEATVEVLATQIKIIWEAKALQFAISTPLEAAPAP